MGEVRWTEEGRARVPSGRQGSDRDARARASHHARYGDDEIVVDIETGRVEGGFPSRALRHVLDWSELHREELLLDWALARAAEPLLAIEPLE